VVIVVSVVLLAAIAVTVLVGSHGLIDHITALKLPARVSLRCSVGWESRRPGSRGPVNGLVCSLTLTAQYSHHEAYARSADQDQRWLLSLVSTVVTTQLVARVYLSLCKENLLRK
jgi:hypothetical protein